MTRKDEWVSVGRVTAPHGVRGAVRVFPLTDVEGRFEQLERVFVKRDEAGDEREPLHITRVAYRKSLVVLQFREITTVEEAEKLRDALLQIPINEVAPLPPDTYYVFQIVGLRVVTVDGREVGTVSDVLTGPANDVYVIKRDGKEPALIPAVREFIKEIDVEKGCMTIDPIPGLLESE